MINKTSQWIKSQNKVLIPHYFQILLLKILPLLTNWSNSWKKVKIKNWSKNLSISRPKQKNWKTCIKNWRKCKKRQIDWTWQTLNLISSSMTWENFCIRMPNGNLRNKSLIKKWMKIQTLKSNWMSENLLKNWPTSLIKQKETSRGSIRKLWDFVLSMFEYPNLMMMCEAQLSEDAQADGST